MPSAPKDLDYYLNLPWGFSYQWINSEGGYYGASVDGLNCFSHGVTMEEATANIREALECHLMAMLESGGAIPESIKASDVKGQSD